MNNDLNTGLGDSDYGVHELRLPEEVPPQNQKEQQKDPAPVLEALVHSGGQGWLVSTTH